MNIVNKTFFVAWAVAFVGWFAGAYVVNVMLIDYSSAMNLFRPREEELTLYPVLILANAILSGAFVWFYAHGLEPRPWLGQGMRFGFAAALFTIVPTFMRYFVAQPMSAKMLIQQVAFFTVLMMILGALVAFVYRGTTTST